MSLLLKMLAVFVPFTVLEILLSYGASLSMPLTENRLTNVV
jgi:hypothetical protein